MLLRIIMLFAVTFMILGFTSNAATSQNWAIGNYKMYKSIATFSQLSDNQINNLVLGNLTTSSKQIIQENQMIFHNEKQNSFTTNEIFTPGKLHNYLKTLLLSKLYLNMNISSLSYHIDDLKSLITNCQVEPKVIGISECRLKKIGVLSNIKYTFEYTNIEFSKGGIVIYINNNIRYKVKNDLEIKRNRIYIY